MDAIIAGIFALAGVALGGALQFLSSRRTARESRLRDLRAESYADVMRAMAAVSAAHLAPQKQSS
ncbi:MAG TPA: hypothetical protein VG722_03335, partial [Tepidisphaeraceae bacterium]|nr:hypothetical protein [Tepidisphaeraceae bacterium]